MLKSKMKKGGYTLKQQFLNKSISFITKYNTPCEEDLIKLQYGLEGLYLTITKMIVILLLSIIFKIFKEVIIVLLLFNLLRFFGFGVHAKKSIDCLVFSSLCFIGLPLLFFQFDINQLYLNGISILSILLLLIFAPADTEKRPFPNTKKKWFRKIMTTLISIFYFIISLYIPKKFAILFILSILIEMIFVNPLTYKLLGQPYNNYKHVD